MEEFLSTHFHIVVMYQMIDDDDDSHGNGLKRESSATETIFDRNAA